MHYIVTDSFDDVFKHNITVKIAEVNPLELTEARNSECTSLFKDQRTVAIVKERTNINFFCNPNNPVVINDFNDDTCAFVVKRNGSGIKVFRVTRV